MIAIARQDALDASQSADDVALAQWTTPAAQWQPAYNGLASALTEAVLNHVSGSRSGIAGVYQRHGWGPEKRAALDAWGKHVEGLLDPASATDNVIRLRRDTNVCLSCLTVDQVSLIMLHMVG